MLEEFSSIDAPALEIVTVGADSSSAIVMVTDCVPFSNALPPETVSMATVAVSLEAAS